MLKFETKTGRWIEQACDAMLIAEAEIIATIVDLEQMMEHQYIGEQLLTEARIKRLEDVLKTLRLAQEPF